MQVGANVVQLGLRAIAGANAVERALDEPSVLRTRGRGSVRPAILISPARDGAAPHERRPAVPKARTTVKLPKVQGCTVSVAASFQGGGQVDVGEFECERLYSGEPDTPSSSALYLHCVASQ
jgi:hypothetical protein